MYLPKILGLELRYKRQFGGLILLIIAGFLGNYFRWTLFFDIDFLFGSIAVWIVVCLYGVKWGTFAGFIAGICTYVIWHHPYTTLTFTAEALFVGWLFHRRQQDNIVLLDALFWLVIGMPLIWLFYAIVLHVDPTQARIILFKQPVNGIFNALIASLLLTHSPIHRWVERPPAISALSLQQTLFNLLVAFVSVPTLVLIILSSNQVVDDIKNTARLDLNDASRYLTVEIRSWYEQRLVIVNKLAELASLKSFQSNTLQENAEFVSETFSEFRHIHILDETGKTVLDFENNVSTTEIDFNQNDYFQQIQTSSQPFISPVRFLSGKSIVLFGVPILENKKLKGAIFTELDLSKITNLLQSNLGKEKLDIILVDQQQTVAASTKSELIGTQAFNWRKDGKVKQIGTQAYHWLPTTGSPLVMVQWQNSLFIKESTIDQTIPWTLVVQIAASSHVRQIEWIQTRNMAILLFVSGLALISATLVSRQLVKPLFELAEITTDIPNKLQVQQPIRWMQSQVTELALLLQNFRTMAASLQQMFGEIKQANEFLEERVEERTQALQQTNIELAIEIDERKRAEKDLKAAEAKVRQLNEELEARVIRRTAQLEAANKALESFSYSVSHDLRSPLRAIDGFARIIQEDYSEQFNAEGNRYLKIVRDNAKRMGELIDDLLDLSRLDRKGISKQQVVFNELIPQIFRNLIPENRQIEFEIANLPICEADLSLITQVWINLLSNAIKYTGYQTVAHIQVGYEIINGEGVYFIKDNGSGFDMQYADNLFGVFQRLHGEQEFAGTGIGLAIVQRIVQRHGGRIWAEAAVNQGATFYFTLPNTV